MVNKFDGISINKLDTLISYCKEHNIEYVTLNSKLSNKIKNYIDVAELNDNSNPTGEMLSPEFRIDKLKFYSSPVILWDDNNLYLYKNNTRINKFNISLKD